jgi:hypothetical protein
MTVEVRLTLEGVDLDRFSGMDAGNGPMDRKGIEEPEYKRSPIESTIIYGFRLQKYVCIYKFWEVTPTEREIEFARLMAKGDNPELRKTARIAAAKPRKTGTVQRRGRTLGSHNRRLYTGASATQ